MYLLDTDIISELRRTRPDGAVLAWLFDIPDSALFISAVTIGELQAGVELTRDQDPGGAAETEFWIDQIAETYNVLPMDARAFRDYARLLHHGSQLLAEDAMIAATALAFNLTVVTRNVPDFQKLDVPTLNPFER